MGKNATYRIIRFFAQEISELVGRSVGVELELRHLSELSKLRPEYQRELLDRPMLRIQKRFNAIAAGILCVGVRDDGSTFLIDGNHRATAALRSGHDQWPCLVVYGLTKEEESALWNLFNSERTTVTAIQKFKAELIAKDPLALAIAKVVHKHNLAFPFEAPGIQRRDVVAIDVLKSAYGNDLLDSMLYVASNSWNGDGYALKSRTLKAVLSVIGDVRNQGKIDLEHLIRSLRNRKAFRAEALYQSAGQKQTKIPPHKYMADSIAEAYNAKMKEDKRIAGNYTTVRIVISKPRDDDAAE